MRKWKAKYSVKSRVNDVCTFCRQIQHPIFFQRNVEVILKASFGVARVALLEAAIYSTQLSISILLQVYNQTEDDKRNADTKENLITGSNHNRILCIINS